MIKGFSLAILFSLMLLAGGVRAEETVAGLMEEGRQLLEKGSFAAALEKFEAVLKITPADAEAFYYAGTIYLRMNEVERGVQYLENSIDLAPDNVRLRFLLAETYGHLRMVEKAIETYQAVVGMAPNSPEGREAEKRSRIMLGKQYGEQGDVERALQIFTSMLAEYPDDLAILLDAGLANLLLNRLDDAQALLERVVLLQPDSGLAHSYLSDVYERKGNIEQAAHHAQRVVEVLPPDSPPVRAARLKLALINGFRNLNQRPGEAVKWFEEALTFDPNNRAARLNLATAYRGVGDLGKAEQWLYGLINENANDLDARLRLGALRVEEKRLDEAAQELEEVMSRGRGSPQARQAAEFLGNLYASAQGKQIQTRILEERINHYRSLVQKNPDDVDAWSELAFIYLGQRKRPEATEAFKNIVRLQPNNGQAHQALGELYDEAADYAKSVVSYTQALESTKDERTKEIIRKQLVMVLAKKSYNEGKIELAEAQFKSIVKKDPDNGLAHFFLGLINTRYEKLEAAVAEYKEVLRIVPGHLGARMYLGMLYEQQGREEEAVPEYRTIVRSGAPAMAENAQRRLKNLEQRIGGFAYTLGYSMSLDNNSNLSTEDPVEELRTDLTGNITYRRKLRGKRISWGVSYSPAYAIYHNSQFDALNNEFSPFASVHWRDHDITASYTYGNSTGLLNPALNNVTQSVYADILKRFKMRPWLPFLAAKDQKNATQSTWRINTNYRTFQSATAPLFDSNVYSLGGLVNQSLGDGWSWSGNYTFSLNSNVRDIGNDFAYNSHGLSFQLSKFLAPGWSANSGYSYTYSLYSNPDSVTRFTQKRTNSFHSLTAGVNFFFSDALRFFSNYSYQMNSSNLPTGFILSPQDANTAVGIQSPSLGDYTKHVLTLGMSMSF